MAKVEIFYAGAAGWRFRTLEGGEVTHTSPDGYSSPSRALDAAGGSSLDEVEILYPEDERGDR